MIHRSNSAHCAKRADHAKWTLALRSTSRARKTPLLERRRSHENHDHARLRLRRSIRIFISKAVILLCAAKKNRDADHLQNFVYDAFGGLDLEQLAAELLAADREPIPDYAFDCHTLKGKRQGKTKTDFFRDEQRALDPFQPGLFDDLAGS